MWGSIGLGIGVLFGVLRNEGLGYIVADGIDWMVLGVGVGLFIKQATVVQRLERSSVQG